MIVADAVLVTVVGTTFAYLLLAIASLRESAQLSSQAPRRGHRRRRDREGGR
jgi:hypothetical protein